MAKTFRSPVYYDVSIITMFNTIWRRIMGHQGIYQATVFTRHARRHHSVMSKVASRREENRRREFTLPFERRPLALLIAVVIMIITLRRARIYAIYAVKALVTFEEWHNGAATLR